jgi:putative hydrolase of the HAD superfamily
MKKRYSAIVFDLGNVLIPFDYSIVIGRINRIEKGLGDKFYEYYQNNYHTHRDFERGKLPEGDFINEMLSALNHRIDAETFCKYYSDMFSLNKEVILLLPLLKKSFDLFLLSNTDPIHKRYGWDKHEFLKYFNKLVLSFEVGSVKPEEKIYRTVEEASGFSPEEHFYIDDIQEYVDAAKKIGWDAVRFENYEKLAGDLKDRKII